MDKEPLKSKFVYSKDKETPFCKWLWDNRMSGQAFTRLSRVSHVSIQKAVRGDPLRLDTIKKIIRFTNGDLTVKDFNVWIPPEWVNHRS